MTAAHAATLPTAIGAGRRWPPHVRLAVTVVVALEALRRFFPGVYGVSERASLAATALVVVAVATVPFAVPLVRRAAGPAMTTGAVAALAAWRLVASFGVTHVAFGAIGAALALVALTAALNEPTPARPWDVVAGLAVDLTVTGAYGSLDPVWQRSASAVLVGVALAFVLGGAAWAARTDTGTAPQPPGGTGIGGGIAVGAVAALEVLFLANPGFVAAVDVSYSEAVALVALGLLAMCAGIALAGASGREVTLVAAAGLALAGWWLPHATKATALVVLLVAQLAAGIVLGDALHAGGSSGQGRGDVGLASGWAVLVVGTLLFQLHYDTALPVDNRWLTALIGGAAALAAFSQPAPLPFPATVPARSLIRWSASVAALTVVGGVVVPAALAATAPEEVTVAPAEAANVVRVVQWNVHQAVDDDGRLDPVAIADALAAQGPIDVLVLHEVARGWPLSGQVDLVTWLSRRLELPYVWGGAASRQFGNAVLTRLPIVASELAELPVADGAQRRSALRVTLVRGAGSPAVDVVATHLQHRNDRESVAARAAEVALLVERYAGLDALVLAGDLNPRQGDPPAYPERRPDRFVEVRALLDAGLTTAADLSACASPTSGRNCSDYVLVGGSLVERSVLVVDGGAFDHRMTVADVVDR